MSHSPNSGHLEPPKLSPIRASFGSRAQSEFINTYTRDSVVRPQSPNGEGAQRSSADAWAFTSSRRNSSPVSPVDPALKGAIGLAALPSPGHSGLVRRGSRTRSEDARRSLVEGFGGTQAMEQGVGETEVFSDELRPERATLGRYSEGNDALYASTPLPQGAFGGENAFQSVDDHFRQEPHRLSTAMSSRGSFQDLGVGSSISHARSRSGSTLYDAPEDLDEFAHAGLRSNAQLPAGVDPDGHLEEGWRPRGRGSLSIDTKGKHRSRRRYSDADAHPVSPLSKRGTLSVATNAIRRASLRVVGLENSVFSDDRPDGLKPDQPLPSDRALPHQRLEDPDDDDDQTSGPEQLRGKSLGLFSPSNPIRHALFRLFRHPVTEPLILGLIVADTIILTIQSAPNVYNNPRPAQGYFHAWEDYALLTLFCFFTIEMFARIIVAGLIFNTSVEERRARKERPRSVGRFFADRFNAHRDLQRRQPGDAIPYSESTEKLGSTMSPIASATALKPAIVLHSGDTAASESKIDLAYEPTFPPKRTYTEGTTLSGPPLSPSYTHKQFLSDAPFRSAVARQKHMTQIAYLRHSWNRVDCVAIIAFWCSFALAMAGLEAQNNLYIFRALSVLRAARLLTITAGTTTILRSLKRAKPLMLDLIFFIVFAGILLSIIGVQSFKGSFERNCVWIDPAGQQNYTFSNQYCGGHFDNVTGLAISFIQNSTNQPFPGEPKGFMCPQGQLCLEGDTPHNGTENFDNVGWAALQVAVIASANTWSNVQYALMDAEYFASCLFFIAGLLVLTTWLFNVMVAVITNTFSDIVDETRHSAFAAGPAHSQIEDDSQRSKTSRRSRLRKFNHWADYFWIGVILASFVMQATRNAGNGPQYQQTLVEIELWFTLALALEMVLRFVGYLPDYRDFFVNVKNFTDLSIAVITLIIQIPVIRNSAVYPWLTFFQILRFYRVILAVPRMKRLLKRLQGSLRGLINMILFLLGINFVAALIAAQYFRGIISPTNGGKSVEMTFYQTWNSILAMYQIFSSENWTDVLYATTAAETAYTQAWIAAIFLTGWFVFANFVLLQLFIAVLGEGFSIPEHLKHKEQLQAFLDRIEPKARVARWYAKLNPYKHLRSAPSAVAVAVHFANLPSEMILPMRRSFVREFLAARAGEVDDGDGHSRFVVRARRALRLDRTHTARPTKHDEGPIDADDPLANVPARSGHALDEFGQARAAQAELIRLHPTYDKPFWVFSQQNSLRRFCQTIVEPSYGERLLGQKTKPRYRQVYQSIVFCAIAASVIVAAIATPPYRQAYFRAHGHVKNTWFNLTELALGTTFLVEFLIKVVADGFLFCPNAYLLSVWNGIDFFVLVTLIVEVAATLIFGNSTSRFTRGLKAFRALRLINLSEKIRVTFYSVFIAGFSNLIDASVLTILYILPFAVWGINIFSGLLYSCNDGNAQNRIGCLGEYVNSPLQWNFLMPRAWINPYVYSFDSFRSAVLILFEIISLEGWINVMTSLMSIVGRDQQPQPNASQANAIYSLVYNLLGATVILTLFLTVIINNFLVRSGSAYLTVEQQQWINIRRLIQRQRPSRRPRNIPRSGLRQWCYARATQKHGWWARMMTALYVLQIAVLMTQTRANAGTWAELVRDFVVLCFAVIYTVDVFVRLLGLGSLSFVLNWWNLYDVIVIGGIFATTIPVVFGIGGNVAIQFQKFFLVMTSFKLITKSNALNQLFKTAIASLPSIAQLFALWLIFFLVWGLLYVEMFSLTRWGPTNISRNSNYQTLLKALVMLSVQSFGEAWNTFMHDYTLEAPYCISSPNFLFSDCGSAGWAFFLFISWNVVSMYIVMNMFTGLVVENFAYVFQLYGKVKSINREEVRAFKKVWSDLDSQRTGYIKRADFIPFFARLTGVFDVSVYPPELRTKALKAACLGPPRLKLGDVERLDTPYEDPFGAGHRGPGDDARWGLDRFDLHELQRRLNSVDTAAVRERKARLNRLYQEALITETPGKGISFTAMMLLLAHHKLIEDDKALQLDELVERKEKLEHVEDRIEFDRIHGVFKTVVQRRKFLTHLAAKRRVASGAPSILVEQQEPDLQAVPLEMPSHSATPTFGLQPHTPDAPSSVAGRPVGH